MKKTKTKTDNTNNGRAKGQTQISISIPVSLVKKVDKLAKSVKRNRSNCIVNLLEEVL